MQPWGTVHVIIPAYNAERYLGEAIRSALAQTLRDIRVVIVDAGSSDGTLAAARAIDDPRVAVVTGPRRGPAPARNAGWRAGAGPSPYIAFLDADDLWDPEKLAIQVAHLEQYPDVVGAGSFMRYVSSTGRVLGRAGESTDGVARQTRIARGALAPFPTSSFVVRRTAFEAVGGFDESFGDLGSEDLDLFARLAQRGRIACLPQELGSYRVHPTSMMARDRRRINAAGRFVQQRIAARAAGGELTLDEFWRSYRPGWRERRQDLVEVCYRSAALWYAERRRTRACGYGLLALIVDPSYTVRRIRRQRGRGA